MNINDIYTKTSSPDSTQGVQSVQSVSRTRATQKVAEKKVSRSDQVQISDRAREMHAALEQYKKLPDVDEEKVARIKAQVETGTYKPDNAQIAEKILAESFLGESR